MRAIVVNQNQPATLTEGFEPKGDGLLVDVHASSVNYKDALAVTGRGKVLRRYPIVPGIDLAGVIAEGPRLGEAVLATGWGLGEERDGGYAEQARVPESFLLPIPPGLDFMTAMALGTAGLTAMLCVQSIGKPMEGLPVLVTGAGGGVGSVAVAILHRLGLPVVAVSGRTETHDLLNRLGASSVIAPAQIAPDAKPLSKERWGGVVDVVGGQVLADALRTTAYGGTVAACGLAGGHELPATVLPFILRGVALRGVDSVRCPNPTRERAWSDLAGIAPGFIGAVTQTIPLSETIEKCSELLDRKVQGRLVVNLRA